MKVNFKVLICFSNINSRFLKEEGQLRLVASAHCFFLTIPKHNACIQVINRMIQFMVNNAQVSGFIDKKVVVKEIMLC